MKTIEMTQREILELKSTVTELKNSTETFKADYFTMQKKRGPGRQDVGIMQSEEQRLSEESLQNSMRRNDTCILGIPKGEKDKVYLK